MSLSYRKTSKELLWVKMFFGHNQSCFEKEKKMFTSFCISAIGKLL